MLIKATFIGTDGSVGYRKGQEYTLSLEHNIDEPDVEIIRLDKTGYTFYSNVETFFKNWTNIKTDL